MSAQRQPEAPPVSYETQLILERFDRIDGALKELTAEVRQNTVNLRAMRQTLLPGDEESP